MKYDEVYKIINESETQTFYVVINGKKFKKNLFISINNNICERAKFKHRVGWVINIENINQWEALIPSKRKKTELEKVKSRLQSIIQYTTNSGLWSNIKQAAEQILSLDDDIILKLLESDYTEQNDLFNKLNIKCPFPFSYNLTKYLKTAKFPKYESERYSKRIKKCIDDREKISIKYINGYDITIDIESDAEKKTDYRRAWYSEEYRNCLNGHYYFLLDDKHVLYCETD